MNKGTGVLEFIDISGDGGVLKKIELEGFGSVPPEGECEVTGN